MQDTEEREGKGYEETRGKQRRKGTSSSSRRRVDDECEKRHPHKQTKPHLSKVGGAALVKLREAREREKEPRSASEGSRAAQERERGRRRTSTAESSSWLRGRGCMTIVAPGKGRPIPS